MSKAAKIAIIGGAVLAFILLLYFFGLKQRSEEYVIDKWDETYDPGDKGPYGTYMLKELLDTTGMFGSFLELNQEIEDVLEDTPDQNDIYFFVGQQNYLSEKAGNFLLDFVANGNTLFMMCEAFPYDLMTHLTVDPYEVLIKEEVYDSQQTFRFQHPSLSSFQYKAKFIYDNKGAKTNWNYIQPENFDLYNEDTLVVCGTNSKNQVNYIRIQYGDGMLFFHSTPYLFTNISLMKKDGFEYAEKVLQHVPPGRVQWDRYNLEYRYDSGEDGSGGVEKRQSILQFILAHPPLAWATILLLIGALLYALFKGKRMQKVIPATESKENTSLGYINTLSSLYLQENKHQKLIKLKEKTFLNFIADHYYISTKLPDDKFISKVALKSQIEKEKIDAIFKLFAQLEAKEVVTDEELIHLHQKIEYFYKKCR
jgi:hypothetical protein